AKPPQPAEDSGEIRRMTFDQRKLLEEQVRRRLQALLAERFQLVIHRDTKEAPVYALVIAKNGPKLKQATADDGPMLQGRPGELIAQSAPMKTLADNLSRQVGRPVLDRTGLKGTYDFKLEWTPDRSGPGNFGPGGPGGPGDRAEGAAPAAPDLSGP